MVAGVKMPVFGGGFWILSDFGELSFFGPCGPCLEIRIFRILHMDKLTIHTDMPRLQKYT